MSLKGGRWCSAPNCRANSNLDTNLSFFSFPLDSERCKTWISNCERLDLLEKTPEYCHTNCKLCASHFEDKMFLNDLKNRLQPHAIPTKFYSVSSETETDANASQIIQESSSPSIPSTSKDKSVQTSSAETSRDHKLQEQLTMDKFLEFEMMCDALLNPKLARFLKCKVRLSEWKKLRNNSKEYNLFALTIYFLSPETYTFFRKTFCLPSIPTLRRMIEKWHLPPGVNKLIFKALKFKVDTMSEKNKVCLLCIDEMSLECNLYYDIGNDEVVGFHHVDEKKNKIAEFAIVGMLRSIHGKWKLPVVYGFTESTCSNNELKDFIYKTIEKLTGIGLDVKAVVSGIGSNFYNFTRKLEITPEKPFFEVGDKRIFYFFDTPHLIKSTRNVFFKYNLIHNNEVMDKKYINMFYDTVKKRNIPTKLTRAHVYPTPSQRTKLKLAAQLFSASVAAVMALQMEFNFLPPSAAKTIHFIDKIDKLFDLMNSSRKKEKKYNKPFTGKQYQIDYIDEMQNMFKDITIVEKNTGKDVTNTIKCFKCWQISLASLKELWRVLECDILYTRRINQDCLENFFCQMRRQGVRCVDPTPIQFQRKFKKLFCLKYLEHEENAKSTEEFLSYIDSVPDNLPCSGGH